MKLRTFVISIPPLYHRLEKTFWPSFKNSRLVNPSLFEGVNGREVIMFPEWWLEKEPGTCVPLDTYNEKAVYGLVQSYLDLFNTILQLELKQDEYLLILEDDSTITEEHAHTFDSDLTNICNNLPDDWQVLFISGREDISVQYEYVNSFILKSSSIMTTNAVMYKGREIVESLRNHLLTFPLREPIDIHLLEYYHDNSVPIYRSIKRLIYQSEYKSSATLSKLDIYTGGNKKWRS